MRPCNHRLPQAHSLAPSGLCPPGAFPDATATMNLLHALFERVAGYGIFALDDLLAFVAPRRRPRKGRSLS